MAVSIRKQLFTAEAIQEAWHRHRSIFRASPSAGVDGVSFKDFDGRVESEAVRLSAEIRGAHYKQLALRPSFIRKDATRFRCINVPAIRDRLVQRILLDHIRERYAPMLAEYPAFGVLRDQGPPKAIHKALDFAADYKWVTRFDIASFFDKVPRDLAARRITAAFPAPSLSELLVSPVHAESKLSAPEQKRLFKECGLTVGLGLRQGQPLSPLYACVYLKPLDQYAKKRNWKYVRYVDDAVIFSNSRADAEFRLKECRQVLQGLSIELSDKPEKTFVRPAHERINFLGVDLVRRSQGNAIALLPKGLQEAIAKDLSEQVDGLLAHKRPGAFVRFCRQIADLTASYKAAYGRCDDWPSLERELPSLSRGLIRKALGMMKDGLDRGVSDRSRELATFWALGISNRA